MVGRISIKATQFSNELRFLGAEMWKFFHLQTRCPLQFLTPKQFPTFVAGFSLPSWLIFKGSFSFHFSKFYENFATLDCFVPRNYRGIFVSVLNFENNRRSLRSRKQKTKKINQLIKYFV